MPTVMGERSLVAYAAPDESMFVAALERALAGGPAVLPMPPGPAAATEALLHALRPHALVDAHGHCRPLPDPLPCAEEVVAVVATSGSSGAPKGVELTHDSLRASAHATAAAIGSGVWLACLPRHHVAGLQTLVRSLLAGHEPILGDLRTPCSAAFTAVVPTMLRQALAEGIDLSGFRAVLVGGAATSTALLERGRRAGIRIVATYGMTETSGGCVYDGVPLAGVRVTLEEDGRIAIRAPQVARGYRGGSLFTDKCFVTADLGRFGADGRLEVIGRADDAIVTGGEKLHPQMIEALLEEHPGVRTALIVGVPDDAWGQRAVAVVVPRDRRSPPSLEALKEYVRQRASAWMAPRELRLVDALPCLASGKVDRQRVIAAIAQSPARMPSAESPPR